MKRFTLIFLFAFFCLVFSLFYQKMYNNPLQEKNVVEDSFAETGASLEKSEIYLWAELDGSYCSNTKLQQLLSELAAPVGIKETSVPSLSSLQIEEIVTISGSMPDNSFARLTVNHSISGGGAGSGKVYLTISLVTQADKTGIEQAEKKVRRIFAQHGIKPRISSCMVGSFNGRLDTGAVDEIIAQFLEGAKARKVEGMSDGNLISVSAFSPLVEESILVGGKKINLNLAARYNGYEDKTYVWLGVPVITIEY